MRSSFVSDTYTRIARVKPALLVVAPAALAILAWFPDAKLGAVWAVIVTSGGTYLMSQVARALGKAKEQDLFAKLGGHPTIKRLKQLDAPNAMTLQRYRRKIQQLLPDHPLPTPEQERNDPGAANRNYLSIMQFLIEQTRDKTRFDLLFQENCQYGFARNLWAMKAWGVGICLVSLAAVCYLAYLQHLGPAGIVPLTLICIATDVIILVAWLFWVTPKLAKIPSEAYADRLLASLDSL